MNIINKTIKLNNNDEIPIELGILSSDEYSNRKKLEIENVKVKTEDIINNELPELDFFDKYGGVDNEKFKSLQNKLKKIDFLKQVNFTHKYITNIIFDYSINSFDEISYMDSYLSGGKEYLNILKIIKENIGDENILLKERCQFYINLIGKKYSSLLNVLKNELINFNNGIKSAFYNFDLYEYNKLELQNIVNELELLLKSLAIKIDNKNSEKFEIDLLKLSSNDYESKFIGSILSKDINVDFSEFNYLYDYKNEMDESLFYSRDKEKLEKNNINNAGNIFKKIKDNKIKSLNQLDNIGIELKITKLSKMDTIDKEKIKKDLIKLYKENYDIETQGEFLKEIEDGIEKMLSKNEEIEFYIFYINGTPLLSSYFKNQSNGELYWGGFNAKDNFQTFTFGFWVFEKLLEEKKSEKINFTVTKEIEGTENKRHSMLIKKYKKYGFSISGEGENNTSKFYKMSNY